MTSSRRMVGLPLPAAAAGWAGFLVRGLRAGLSLMNAYVTDSSPASNNASPRPHRHRQRPIWGDDMRGLPPVSSAPGLLRLAGRCCAGHAGVSAACLGDLE